MNPGDVLRAERTRERLQLAERMLKRSMHLGAAAAVCGIVAGALIVRRDFDGAWALLLGAFGLNWASHRASRRARELL